MKNRRKMWCAAMAAGMIVVAPAFFTGCSTIAADVAKAQSWLGSPQGQTAQALIDTVANGAISAFGGKNAAKEAAALQGVDLFAGTLQKGTAPTTGQIQSVLSGLGVSSTTSGALAPAASTAIQLAIANGLNATAATTAVNSIVQTTGAKVAAASTP